MMRGMYSAISGLEAHQTMLDVTANNLANVDTIGYKGQRTTFDDELSQQISAATSPNTFNGGSNAEQIGLGVQVGSVDNLMGEGSFQSTGNPLDVAIQGAGFLEVGDGNPQASSLTTGTPSTLQYTRAGNLTTNSQGYLITQSGQYVMGQGASTDAATGQLSPNGTRQYLKVPTDATNVAIGQNGQITYTDDTGKQQTAGYLETSTFPNSSGLIRNGGSTWSESAASGAPTVTTPGAKGAGTTIGGELEMSNVDMATEFTNMITAERGYQANSKVITTADQMLQTVVNMAQG